jgi:acyl carrier protein
VPDRSSTAAAVRLILAGCWPGRFRNDDLDDGVSIGEEGLGLDSIEIVEFLFACEEELHGRATEEFLAAGPVSLGQVVDHFARA